MFMIRSYIHYPDRPIYDLRKVEQNPLYYFIDIDNTLEIIRIKKDLDLDYIEGVLHLTYNNQIIIDFTYYDLIDHLWAYFLNMIKEYLETQKSETSFPDQPLPMSIENISDDYLLFSINSVEWKLPKYAFFNVLLRGAKDFFEKMIFLIPEKKDTYLFQLNKIKELRPKIDTLNNNIYH